MLLVHGDPTNEELQRHGSNQEASRMSGWEAWRESSRASLVCYKKDLLHYRSLDIRKSRQGMLMVALVFAPMYPMAF
jgi:hypothetical protein